ncbi:MAG: hypothetical protein JOZ90_01120 [Alphaproteobacteria bacterium]|nr:hypothetical protein [Alphaproteobacteria bacterium]MBV9370889.1 hypothetical protein [Alphaproteobacteria bacterium]MBV9899679.1 hypothetical protein [Alphaproteobacteria bacterium]
MRNAIMMAGAVLLAAPSAASANAEADAVKAVVKAVAHGEDMAAAFPGAVTPREAASLRRLAKCAAHNLMRQAKGRYTVVWVCGHAGALGMEVVVTDGRVSSVSTMEVVARPALEPR